MTTAVCVHHPDPKDSDTTCAECDESGPCDGKGPGVDCSEAHEASEMGRYKPNGECSAHPLPSLR